jgi:N4-gp56 family major capsid protein
VEQPHPGASIVFQLYNDLTAVTTPLTETTDPDAVAVPSTTSVTVTLQEYGNPVLVTRKLELVALSDVDAGIVDLVAWNMRDSIDATVMPTVVGGTNVAYVNSAAITSNLRDPASGSRVTVASTDSFRSALARFAVAKLRTNKAIPRQGEHYGIFLHPDCSHDLRAETGAANWRDPHNYSGAESIWNADIGVYEGAYYVESPRMPILAGAGVGGTVNVYQSIAFGKQFLAEAVGEEPMLILGNITDKLMRFRPIGWRTLIGWSRYREEALIRLECASSIQ